MFKVDKMTHFVICYEFTDLTQKHYVMTTLYSDYGMKIEKRHWKNDK